MLGGIDKLARKYVLDLAGQITRRLSETHLVERRPYEIMRFVVLRNLETTGSVIPISGVTKTLEYLIDCTPGRFAEFAIRITEFSEELN